MRSMSIFGVQNFTLDQYLGSVNYNMNKIQYLGSKNLKKGTIMEVYAGLHNIRLNIWGPQTLRIIFRGQQRNSGIDPPVLKVREYPPWVFHVDVNKIFRYR